MDEYIIHAVSVYVQPWAQDLRLLDGRLITCAISPIAAGATMVAFKTAITAQPSKSVLAAKAARKVTTAA
ncbi:MAG: hypothetical protein U5N55_06735 [Cypionkella sp.]|nr:hypothetical protein [Cypionkella sp.]